MSTNKIAFLQYFMNLAIQDAGIPVDMVGGVSIGAFMGALYCLERNTTTLTQKAREWSKVTMERNTREINRILPDNYITLKIYLPTENDTMVSSAT